MGKNVNLIECSGRITYKHYDEERGQFFFVLYIAVPRVSRRHNESRTDVVRDAPGFVYEGNDAKELYDAYKIDDMITVIGHAGTDQIPRPQGNRVYKMDFVTSLIADSIMPNHGMSYVNNAVIAGNVTYVYRNPDQGKRFYIITVETNPDSKEGERTSVTYFDQKMALEPKRGDYIHAFGVVQVKHDNESSSRDRILTTIVSRTVGLVPHDGSISSDRPRNIIRTRNNIPDDPEPNDDDIVDSEPVENEEWVSAE